MNIREWGLTQWLIAVAVFIMIILGAVVVYVVLTPTALVPRPPAVVAPEVPYVGLPPALEGPPEFPALEYDEFVPLAGIQGVGVEQEVDIIATGGITQMSTVFSAPVEHVALGATGSGLNYYDPATSKFYTVDTNGNVTKMSDRVFAEVENVTWSSRSTDAIVEFPDGSNVMYDAATDDQITLPAHWEDFDFAPSSEQIAFKSIALDPSQRWLAVSDNNGGGTRRIAHLGENEDLVDVDWAPNNQVIGTYSKPDGLSNSELYFVGFNNENFPLTKVHGLKAEGRWNPSGSNLMYSSIHQDSNFNPTLWIVDGPGTNMGGGRKRINLQTWTDKCTFASDTTAYCGVPTELPRGAGLIPSIAHDINDELFAVDLQSGAVTRIAIPERNINVEQLQLSDDGSELFIHDRFSGGLVKVQLD